MDINERLASKEPLIARVAWAFIRRTGWIEYDDAVQIVTLAAWQVLADEELVGDVDGAIVSRGFCRLTDELRSGRVTGIKRGIHANGGRVAVSLDRVVDGSEGIDMYAVLGRECPEYEACELVDDIANAVARLPGRERAAVYLYYWESLTLAAIAELFGVSESRVSQIITSARNRMQPLLAA